MAAVCVVKPRFDPFEERQYFKHKNSTTDSDKSRYSSTGSIYSTLERWKNLVQKGKNQPIKNDISTIEQSDQPIKNHISTIEQNDQPIKNDIIGTTDKNDQPKTMNFVLTQKFIGWKV